MFQPFESFCVKGRVISVIGSGGKTTFLRYLAMRLSGTVILTTSTHIFPFPGIPLIVSGPDKTRSTMLQEIRNAFSSSRIISLGEMESSGKLRPATSVSFEDLLEAADTVLIEADGAKGLPLKAHRTFEPVIPACTEMIVCIVGASGIGKPVRDVCHCPDLFSNLAGISTGHPADAVSIAAVLNRENLADYYLINQTDILPDPAPARQLCELLQKPASLCALAPAAN